MSTSIEWQKVLDEAAELAAKLGPLVPVAPLAVAIARVAVDAGCLIANCPADVELKPADLPDVARAFRDAEQVARDRVSGR